MKEKTRKIAILLALMALLAACAKKKKADDFQNFGGISYNAAPKSISATLGLNIKVQAIDINYDGKMDGLYVCRTGGIKQFTVNASGSGYTNSPTVTIAPSGGSCSTNPAGVGVVANGRVERIVITNSGSNCNTNSFNVTLTAPGAGTTATAYVTGASGGRVTRVSMLQKGSGYAAPLVTITGGGGSGATAGVHVAGGGVQGVYLLEPGDGLFTTQPTVTITGDTGAGADAAVALPDVIVSELDTNGNCTVTYDPEDTDADGKRYIPQMLFTWPVTPTVGLDVNGDTNADYYLYTNDDGSSQVMTNSDGSGAVARLIVKNPMIDETNDTLYAALDYGQVIGFDVLGNNTIANNILGKIALDRVNDVNFADRGNPMPIISPIRNDEFYAAPMDVNILCSDRVACNAITYSLFRTGEVGPHNDPDFSSTNLDPTGVDYSGTMHAIKPGDSGTISFQNLPFGNYALKYKVRDAAGNVSGSTFNCAAAIPVNCIRFTIGRKPDISIISVGNRYVSTAAPANPAEFKWTADTGSLTKPFRYLIAVNGSCIGYTRAQFITPPAGVITGGPFTSGDTVTTNIAATATGMLFNDTNHGINYITICAITCEVAACNAAAHLSVWGDAFETVIRDDTAPSITASPLSGMFSLPQRIFLSGSTTVGEVAPSANGSLVPNEICYAWGADASGNPKPAEPAANPVFPCPAGNNYVHVTGSSNTQLNLGCNSRASVTDLNTNPDACPFTPGIYYLKFIARDAAGNVTPVQTQAYAVGVTPQITTNQAPHQHVWQAHAGWGNSGDATLPAPALGSGQTVRSQTTWAWQTDFPGTYQVRMNDATIDCTGGTLSTHASATGTVVALTPITVTILAADLNIDINTVKICYWPSGGGAVNSSSQQIWKVLPINFNNIPDVSGQNVSRFNVGETVTIALSDLYTPVSAIQSVTFNCAPGSTGVDANPGCTPPTAIGSVVRPGVNTLYQLPALPANRVTTLAYDVRITVCNTSSCSAAAGPTFGTEAAAPYVGSATAKVFILQDKTAGNSIYVDNANGDDSNPGTVRTAPKRSLSNAAAGATGGKAIYVVGGNYCGNGPPPCAADTGTLNLPSNTSLYGGFTSAWYRPDVASNRAIIIAGSNDSANSIGVNLAAVNSSVRVEGINLTAQRPTPTLVQGYSSFGLRATAGAGTLVLYKNSIVAEGDVTLAPGADPGSTYGVYINAVNTFIMQNTTVTAGRGWIGANGGLGGTDGSNGGNGNNGIGGSCDGGCPIFGCGGCQNGGSGGGGGTSPISNNGGNGGRGGAEDSCVASGDGANGTIGLPSTAFGNGGGSGNPGNQGGDGTGGASGGSGSGGIGGTGGTVTSGVWIGVQGGNGTSGGNGTGGGGGGGGGAQWSGAADNGPGNGGGGGGGGGSAGSGGEGGHAGGASIALFLYNTQATLSQNTLNSSDAGKGGDGKLGGAGGTGGSGGSGGANCTGEIRRGGNGGAGGSGGGGGRGGGGQGGPSLGISGYSATLLGCTGNSINLGNAGSGGAGASAGSNGFAHTCYDFSSPGTCTCP